MLADRERFLMSGIVTRLLVIIGLVVGAATHGSIAAAATGGNVAGMDAASCDMTKSGKMKPADCASVCAVGSADIARVASLLPPFLVRPSWRMADLSADGLQPSPDPTPPRA
jgi:hypothetical protein